MKDIKILDCTLRDGGYVNEWNFGKENIVKIITKLNEANIDIIECGFWRDDISKYEKNKSIYKSFEQVVNLNKKMFDEKKQYALMVLTEKCDISKLEDKKQNFVDIIRLSFHKRDMKKALKDAEVIKQKGYKLFMQPTATMRYTDGEIVELLKLCNGINPDSVAIVDTFGEMQSENIIHLTKLFDKYLDKSITLSFHSHNNIQTAFSNALLFINTVSKNRKIVIDSSVYGMGRGAGNLCTELITNYLNITYNKEYLIFPLLEIVDNILSDIKKDRYWGYSLEYYLSAVNHCHPNYCIYFSDKKTLPTYDLAHIVSMISEDKKTDFDREYADELYLSYCSRSVNDKDSYDKLFAKIGKRKIVLLGPGKSINNIGDDIKNIIEDKEHYFVIGINNKFKYDVDAYFISNRKRFSQFDLDNELYLLTSNIDYEQSGLSKILAFNYNDLLATEYGVSDNSLLLILNLLKKFYNKTIYLIGFDGFDYNQANNFYDNKLIYLIEKNSLDKLNNVLKKYVSLYRKHLDIKFLTKSLYDEGFDVND